MFLMVWASVLFLLPDYQPRHRNNIQLGAVEFEAFTIIFFFHIPIEVLELNAPSCLFAGRLILNYLRKDHYYFVCSKNWKQQYS